MKKAMLLSLQGKQYYPGQEPEVIELVTEGTMTFRDGGWDICYEESDLTGLAGVTTTFRVEPGQVSLHRTGKLRSELRFAYPTFLGYLWKAKQNVTIPLQSAISLLGSINTPSSKIISQE